MMIDIRNITIDKNSSEIRIKAKSDNSIRKILLFHNDMKSESKDISALAELPSKDIEFNIPSDVIGNTDGVWFIQFIDDADNKKIGVAADLTKYEEILLSRVLQTEIDGCNIKSDTCSNSSINSKEITQYMFLILSTLKDSIKFGFYNEIPTIINQLEELTQNCDNRNIVLSNSNYIINTNNQSVRNGRRNCNCHK